MTADEMKEIRKFGLIGYPLEHSFSPAYFADKFRSENITDATYDAYPIAVFEDLMSFRRMGLIGLNVTIPYKETILPYLDVIHDEAARVGAVNTVHFTKSGIVGHNTDIYGFEQSLLNFCGLRIPVNALVLGTGGASKAVQFVLSKLRISHTVVSRTGGDLTYAKLNADIIRQNLLIINTTPVGTSPNIDKCPKIPYDHISEKHLLYDLVYNPEKTLFLTKGFHNGASVKNGLQMLKLQAEKSWLIWNQDTKNDERT